MVMMVNNGRYVARNGQIVTVTARKYRTAAPAPGTRRNYPFWGDFNSPSRHRAGKKATYTVTGLFEKSGVTSAYDLIRPFKVEAGKTYLTRNGKTVTVRARAGGKNYPFEGDVLSERSGKPVSYTADGLYQRGAVSPLDLVQELTPPGRFNTARVTPPPAPVVTPPAAPSGQVVVVHKDGMVKLTKGGQTMTFTAAEYAAITG